MEVNAALTLPVAQAEAIIKLTEQDATPIPPGALAKIVIIMGVVMKKLMEKKQKLIQIVMIPEFVVFQIQKKRIVLALEIPMVKSVEELTVIVLPANATLWVYPKIIKII